MLSENIKVIRKSKGLSQESLAVRLNVVRQTVSKWEQGLSVPDAELLLALSEVLETPVSSLLGETVAEPEADSLKVIAEKLEAVNLALAREKAVRRRAVHWALIALSLAIVAVFAALAFIQGSYLKWDYSQPEAAAAGVILHGFEWLFVRTAPFALLATVAGACLTRKKA